MVEPSSVVRRNCIAGDDTAMFRDEEERTNSFECMQQSCEECEGFYLIYCTHESLSRDEALPNTDVAAHADQKVAVTEDIMLHPPCSSLQRRFFRAFEDGNRWYQGVTVWLSLTFWWRDGHRSRTDHDWR